MVWLLPVLAETAEATELELGTFGGYRGYFGEVDGLVLQEHLFEENLRAELDTALVDRSLAAWHVGFALDHNLTIGQQVRRRVLGYEYDTDLQLNSDGALPLRLFAARQLTGATTSLYPGASTQSDTVGYQAALRPPGLPQLQSSALFQRRQTDAVTSVRDERSSIVNGQLLHNDNRLMAIAKVEQRRNAEPVLDDRRDVSEGSAFVEYRLDKNTSVVSRTRARRYDSTVRGESFLLDTLVSDAAIRTRPSDKLNGTTFYRITDQAGVDHHTGDAAVGTTWTWYPTDELSGIASVGFGDSWAADAGGSQTLLGQYANLSANRTTSSRNGGWQLYGQTGFASVLDGPGGGGVQGGGAAGTVLRRMIGPVQVSAGGDLGRQLDSSERAQTYDTWGWLAELASRPLGGVQLQLQATESVIAQRALDEGDSDRFRVIGLVALRPELRLDVVYGLNLYRDVLDEEYSTGVGHAVSLRAVPTERIQMLALYRYGISNASSLSALYNHRVEGTVLYRLPVVTVSARVAHARAGGRIAPAATTLVWVELAREFRWDL